VNEAFYDAEIAPVLLDLGRKCQERGISFVASVEYAHDETGETVYVNDAASFKTRLAAAATRCHGNVDSLIQWIMRYAGKHGHSSLSLKVLGVPTEIAPDPKDVLR
jgi:hypothetical protein